MKAVIFTEGGKKIGFGHVTRCLALYYALKMRGISVHLIINGDKTIQDILRSEKYIRIDWIKENSVINKLIKGSDIVIVDSYLANRQFYARISKLSNVPVYLDDNKRLDYPFGIVINGVPYANELGYRKQKGAIYLLGLHYALLRKEFWDIPQINIRRKIKRILITFGGMQHFELINNLAGYLESQFGVEVYAVDKIKPRCSARRMLNLMLKSDLCICGGGQTTNEVARCGLPSIGVCFADNQSNNLLVRKKNGFLESAGWYNDRELFGRIKEIIDRMDYRRRLFLSLKGRRFIDGQGAIRAVDTILDFVPHRKS